MESGKIENPKKSSIGLSEKHGKKIVVKKILVASGKGKSSKASSSCSKGLAIGFFLTACHMSEVREMELIKYPNPILSQKCAEVEVGASGVSEILDEMSKKLYEWEGAGLAAPQVGILKRIVVIDIREEPPHLYKLINPKITRKSEEMVESNEGCLSLPILREMVFRHASVTVEYLDENFKEKQIEATGFLSCCLQHELDHLDGVLYIDRLSKFKRSRAIKEFYKLQEEKPEDGGE